MQQAQTQKMLVNLKKRPISAHPVRGNHLKKDKSMKILTKDSLLKTLQEERASIMGNRIAMHDITEDISHFFRQLLKTQSKILRKQPQVFQPPQN